MNCLSTIGTSKCPRAQETHHSSFCIVNDANITCSRHCSGMGVSPHILRNYLVMVRRKLKSFYTFCLSPTNCCIKLQNLALRSAGSRLVDDTLTCEKVFTYLHIPEISHQDSTLCCHELLHADYIYLNKNCACTISCRLVVTEA